MRVRGYNSRSKLVAGAGLLALGGVLALCGVLAGVPARAELADERLRLQQSSLTYGTGTPRLDGMGLHLALKDENDEIDLFDYGDNPAGLYGDRDAWSVDTRFSHQERFERNPDLPGNRFKSNSYSFLGSAHASNGQAFGGGIDFIQSSLEPRGEPRTDFTNSRLRFIYSREVGLFSVGGELRVLNENENIRNSPSNYSIAHKTTNVTGVVGLSYRVQDHVTIGGRGALRQATVNGRAESDSHLDKFTWDRPSGSAAGQAFFDFPKVNGAVILERTKGAGEEKLAASWSLLFSFNPSTLPVEFERRTFTEDLARTEFRTRWRYDLAPDRLTLAASYEQNKQTAVTRISQVTLGSRGPSDIALKYRDIGVGAGLHLAEDRLFVGAEAHNRSDRYDDLDPFTGYTNKVSTTSLAVGTEYLALENVAARAGLVFSSDDRTFDQGLSGTYGTSAASFGLGLVPSGGILQMDAAYMITLHSGLDVDQSAFSLYARLLF